MVGKHRTLERLNFMTMLFSKILSNCKHAKNFVCLSRNEFNLKKLLSKNESVQIFCIKLAPFRSLQFFVFSPGMEIGKSSSTVSTVFEELLLTIFLFSVTCLMGHWNIRWFHFRIMIVTEIQKSLKPEFVFFYLSSVKIMWSGIIFRTLKSGGLVPF